MGNNLPEKIRNNIPQDLLSFCDYGKIIPNSIVCDIFDTDEEDPQFPFQQLKFAMYLENRLEEEMPCTICIRDGQLYILTHEEAATHNPRMFGRHCNSLKRSHYRTLKVDPYELESDESRKQLKENIHLQSKILQSIDDIKEEFILQPYESKTPRMVEVNETNESNQEEIS